jgi:hypothetical protein
MGAEDQPAPSFAGEVRTLAAAVRKEGLRPLDAARQLQTLWRHMHGFTSGEDGVADGSMLAAVRAALDTRG